MLRKKIMTIIMTVVMSLGLCSAAFAAEGQPPMPPAHGGTIAVEGKGEASVAPDMATIRFSVVTEGKTAQLAQASNAEQANKLTAALNSLGIFSKDIQTTYSVSPTYDREYRKVVGYRAVNSINVNINDIDKVGTVIDTALANGASDVDSLNFGLKDPSAARNTALKNAVTDARSKADAIASTLGVQITGVQRVSESHSMPEFNGIGNARLMSMEMAVDNAPSTPVNPGMITVNATVSVDYQIQ